MAKNKPFRLLPAASNCWTSGLALDGARALGQQFDISSNPPKVLILYGSLRKTSFSRLLAYEYARILEDLGCDVQVFNPRGKCLPVKDDTSDNDPKVTELRNLSIWSEGQIWVSPEQHGTITGVFKNMSRKSFGSFSSERRSSIPKAWTEFDMVEGLTDELELPVGRLKASSFRDRVVDVAEEFFKFMVLLRGKTDFLVDRYSEREEKKLHGRLLAQAEKEDNAPTNK
ncbi:hypothetical protein CcCBS67573_g07206 [Chytriomyces confervae]|uniref:NADPH-dependent FMN reductase-like domain-containing protein n=1 Tax=Chytriomyces confervae TaxID=246404 RepID=A0A507EY75_9FUNG|nr:hypothetical protein CcCBS67573_g07206 [Chytriomyces confervae]